jgi:hypothetical protein
VTNTSRPPGGSNHAVATGNDFTISEGDSIARAVKDSEEVRLYSAAIDYIADQIQLDLLEINNNRQTPQRRHDDLADRVSRTT